MKVSKNYSVGDKVTVVKPISSNPENPYNKIGFVFTVGTAFNGDIENGWIHMEEDDEFYTEDDYVRPANPLELLL